MALDKIFVNDLRNLNIMVGEVQKSIILRSNIIVHHYRSPKKNITTPNHQNMISPISTKAIN